MDKSKILLIVAISLLLLGLTILFTGGALTPFYRNRINEITTEKFSLKPGTDVYKLWLNDSEYYEKFYLFHINNSMDVQHERKKPYLVQMGPYTYRVKMSREDVNSSEHGQILAYTERKQYIFAPELSVGKDSTDTVTTANIPIISLASMLRYADENMTSDINNELTDVIKEELFVDITVKDLLWGYSDRGLYSTLLYLKHKYHIHPIKDRIFGLQYQSGEKEGSKSEKYSINSGVYNINNVFQIMEWNKLRKLSYWTSEYSNRITGTEARSWSPYLDSSRRLESFQPEWCRSLYYTNKPVSNRRDDLKSQEHYINDDSERWTYSMPREVLDKTEQNAGFCTPAHNCTENGLLNATVCKKGFPMYLSQPQFLHAPYYLKAVDGLHPDPALHGSKLDLEPTSGYVTNSELRMQYNVELKSSDAFEALKIFNESLILPVAWKETLFNMSSHDEAILKSLSDEFTSTRDHYRREQIVILSVGGLLTLCGLIGLVIVLVIHMFKSRTCSPGTEDAERRPLLHDRE